MLFVLDKGDPNLDSDILFSQLDENCQSYPSLKAEMHSTMKAEGSLNITFLYTELSVAFIDKPV